MKACKKKLDLKLVLLKVWKKYINSSLRLY